MKTEIEYNKEVWSRAGSKQFIQKKKQELFVAKDPNSSEELWHQIQSEERVDFVFLRKAGICHHVTDSHLIGKM
jgi:hypothetical protein